MRTLTEREALAALLRGASVEQFLPGHGDPGAIAWLSATGTPEGLRLRMHHVRDEGADDFLDVTEFSPVDDDQYVGEGRVIGTFSSDEALVQAATAAGAIPDRWVNSGMIQAVYEERRALITLVQRIQLGDFATDTELESLVATFDSAVVHPDAHGLIYWPGDQFDHEPTAAEVVDKALAYHPTAL